MVEKATMESKTKTAIWKSIKHWFRNWCQNDLIFCFERPILLLLLLLSFFPSTTQTIPPFRTNSTFCYTSLHSAPPLLLCLSYFFNISSGTVGHCIHFWTTPLLHNHHLDVVAFWGLFSFCFNRPFFYRCFFSSRFTIA